jgi:hypothetical protein
MSSTFYEPWYLAQNAKAGEAIAAGQYQSGLDYYLQAGQFLKSGEAGSNQRTLWNGTDGNDVVTGIAPKNTGSGPFVYLSGVASDAVGKNFGEITVKDVGVGQIDVLIGTAASDRFILGGKLAGEDTLSSFYLGHENGDYAYIKGFDASQNDELFLAGQQADYEFEIVGGNTQISHCGDLVAIVEGELKLIPSFFDRVEGGTALWSVNSKFIETNSRSVFNEAYYLANNPDAKADIAAGLYKSGFDHFLQVGVLDDRPALYNGIAGKDPFFYTFGAENYIFTVPVTQFDLATGTYRTETLGVGEDDHAHGSRFGTDYFFLGDGKSDFYIGQGKDDSFLIGDFDPKEDFILLSNSTPSYKIELVENLSTRGGPPFKTRNIFNADGDLMARIEDGAEFELVPYPTQILGMYALVSPENKQFKQLYAAQPAADLKFQFTMIDVPGGTETEVFDISNDGKLIGSYLDDNKVRRGFSFQDGRFATFSITDSPTRGFGLNSSGQTVGYYQPPASKFEQYGFLREPDGSVTTIGYPGQTYNYAFRINESGAVGGFYFEFPTPDDIFITSFRRDPDGSFEPVLFSTEGEGTVLRGLNDANTQVGWWLKPDETIQGLIYQAGAFTTFDVPTPEQTLPQDINNSGYIVGYSGLSETLATNGRGFLREPDGDIAFFQVPGAMLTEPLGLNDLNQVVGTYTDLDGVVRGFFTNALAADMSW